MMLFLQYLLPGDYSKNLRHTEEPGYTRKGKSDDCHVRVNLTIDAKMSKLYTYQQIDIFQSRKERVTI